MEELRKKKLLHLSWKYLSGKTNCLQFPLRSEINNLPYRKRVFLFLFSVIVQIVISEKQNRKKTMKREIFKCNSHFFSNGVEKASDK